MSKEYYTRRGFGGAMRDAEPMTAGDMSKGKYDPVAYAHSLGVSGDPKGEAGAAKPGLDNISLAAQYYEGAVMKQGADTYGAYNWCEHSMKASTYYNAIQRHLSAWEAGEDLDPKSGFPHMAHVRASAGIIIDQQETDRMIDDRPKMLAPLKPVWEKIMKVLNPAQGKKRGTPTIPNEDLSSKPSLQELYEKGLKDRTKRVYYTE